jgi:multicomponent Na+:H+ antiporter subunit A
MTLFMVSMVGLACARDLILLFVFFDLTAVASYFLIGFDRNRREARGAALMALLVTGISAVALLLGAVLLYNAYGTFSLAELFERARSDTTTTIACALIAVSALAKSAQVPLHFWLPRAIAAPTPVSAYLHSAAMVREFLLDADDARAVGDSRAVALAFARSAFQHACSVCGWDPTLPASAAGTPPPVS